MSGLDKIISAIEQEAQQKADELLAEAQKSVADIEQKSKTDDALFKERFFEDVELECRQITERAASDDRQKRKRQLLKVRSDVIEQVIEQAYAKVESMPDSEYFDFLLGIFKKNAGAGDGEIRFSGRDEARLPKDFIDQCNAALSTGSVKLGQAVDSIDGGFIITYGKIEQNCSLKSVFETNKNMLWDKVNAYLIAEA